jgi:hypothetical protein
MNVKKIENHTKLEEYLEELKSKLGWSLLKVGMQNFDYKIIKTLFSKYRFSYVDYRDIKEFEDLNILQISEKVKFSLIELKTFIPSYELKLEDRYNELFPITKLFFNLYLASINNNFIALPIAGMNEDTEERLIELIKSKYANKTIILIYTFL